MNCQHAKVHLVEMLYGEIASQPKEALNKHLATCNACREKLARLQRGQGLLETLEDTPVRLEAAALLKQAAAAAQRSRRCWRRTAIAAALGALAACLVLAANMKIHVRSNEFAISWGAAAPQHNATPATPAARNPWPTLREHQQRLAALDELARLLMTELETTEHRQSAALVHVQDQLGTLRTQTALRWQLLDRDMRDLGFYVARNSSSSDNITAPATTPDLGEKTKGSL